MNSYLSLKILDNYVENLTNSLLKVVLWLSELRSVSAKISFEFYNQAGELVATGEQTGLFIGVESQRPYKLSEVGRKQFLPYVAQAQK